MGNAMITLTKRSTALVKFTILQRRPEHMARRIEGHEESWPA